MKARVDGIEAEGTVDELIEFVRRYVHVRALPAPPPQSDHVSEEDLELFPYKCTHCHRRFSTDRGRKHHESTMHPDAEKPLTGPQQEGVLTRDQLDTTVLDHLYPYGGDAQVRMMQGRTIAQVADEVGAGRDDIRLSLWRLVEKKLACHEGGGQGPNGYLFFRGVK